MGGIWIYLFTNNYEIDNYILVKKYSNLNANHTHLSFQLKGGIN